MSRWYLDNNSLWKNGWLRRREYTARLRAAPGWISMYLIYLWIYMCVVGKSHVICLPIHLNMKIGSHHPWKLGLVCRQYTLTTCIIGKCVKCIRRHSRKELHVSCGPKKGNIWWGIISKLLSRIQSPCEFPKQMNHICRNDSCCLAIVQYWMFMSCTMRGILLW